MDLTKILTGTGLTEKEAKVYLSLLELKEALPSTIAKKAGVKRPTGYLILDELIKKGLASKVKKGAYYYFQAISPHSLLEDQYTLYNNLEKALPELLKLNEIYSVKPEMSFFEGKEGLIRIMEDTLATKTEILCWADTKLAFTTVLKDYYPSYVAKKVRNKVWLRGILCYDEYALAFKKKSKEELREVYLISRKEYPFKNEINIYDDKIAIISHQDKIGVIIRNQNIADTQRSIFNFAFKYAKIAEKEVLTKKDLKYLNQ
ncbi:MAG: helix-turn-helix domain-containing protein [Candidatus Gracilibacteria bacterium]|jgi:sugar-specific transcriptional regulator TrmB